MGVTVHYRLARRQTPEFLLKRVEQLAIKLGMEIVHRSWNHLIVHPHEQSESIELHWHKVKTIKKRTDGWNHDQATMKDIGILNNEDWYCSGFVKTHYAGVQAHFIVVEFMRFIASHCFKSEISDEADTYESELTDDKIKELKEYWDDYNKSISLLASKLKETFGSENVVCGGDG